MTRTPGKGQGCSLWPPAGDEALLAVTQPGEPAVRKPDPASRAVSSSPRRGIRGNGIAKFTSGDDGSAAAPVVNDHRAGGGQGGAGGPVVVAAQQQINRMPASRGGRDEDPPPTAGPGSSRPDYPDCAAWTSQPGHRGAFRQPGRRGDLPAFPALRRGNLILIQPASKACEPSHQDLALVPDGTFGPKHPGRPPCHRGRNASADSDHRWQTTMIPGENQTTAESGAGIEMRLGLYATGRFPRPPGLARWPHPDVRAEVSRWPSRNGVAVARTRRRRPTGRGG